MAHSWDGRRTRPSPEEFGCHPQTVRERLQACNERGLDGLGMKLGSGRKPRLTEQERSTILALVHLPAPGKPTYELTGELAALDPAGEPEWTLDTLTAAAQEHGIEVARSQVRRIFRREGVRWRRTRLWARSKEPDCVPRVPQGSGSSRSPRSRPRARPSSVWMNAAPYSPYRPDPRAISRPLAAGQSMGTASKCRSTTSGDQRKCGGTGRCACATGRC